MPGAPTISGTDDASHFYNQPPPVAGLNFSPEASDAVETTHDISLNELHQRPTPSPQTETGGSTPGPRARFPDNEHELQQVFSAPPIPVDSRISRPAGETDREPSAHRGPWQAFRNWLDDWREDFGSPQAHQDITNLIGDAGIDPQILKKIKSGRISSLVSSTSQRTPSQLNRALRNSLLTGRTVTHDSTAWTWAA